MLNRGLDKLELLRIVEAVANEKSIDKELVIGSMESAIQKAALTKFGNDNNIEVIIDRESGEIKIHKVLDIVEKVEDPAYVIKNAIPIDYVYYFEHQFKSAIQTIFEPMMEDVSELWKDLIPEKVRKVRKKKTV